MVLFTVWFLSPGGSRPRQAKVLPTATRPLIGSKEEAGVVALCVAGCIRSWIISVSHLGDTARGDSGRTSDWYRHPLAWSEGGAMTPPQTRRSTPAPSLAFLVAALGGRK
jgi:hypothetical protein